MQKELNADKQQASVLALVSWLKWKISGDIFLKNGHPFLIWLIKLNHLNNIILSEYAIILIKLYISKFVLSVALGNRGLKIQSNQNIQMVK